MSNNSESESYQTTSLHRHRTLYLVRHGEAIHNVKEAEAQEKARQAANKMGLSESEKLERMEEARKLVLHDKSLFDAPLTDKGKIQAKEAGEYLAKLIYDDQIARAPTEAMVSPLSRCLETAEILLQQHAPRRQQAKSQSGDYNKDAPLKVHIRPELRERQTQYPPDTHRNFDHLFHWTQQQRYTHTAQDDDNRSCSFQFHVKEHALKGHDLEEEESRTMLRERASKLFNVLMEMQHTHILIVSHKGYLREMERGLLGLDDSPLFGNAEVRVYRVVFTKGDRSLTSVERLA